MLDEIFDPVDHFQVEFLALFIMILIHVEADFRHVVELEEGTNLVIAPTLRLRPQHSSRIHKSELLNELHLNLFKYLAWTVQYGFLLAALLFFHGCADERSSRWCLLLERELVQETLSLTIILISCGNLSGEIQAQSA